MKKYILLIVALLSSVSTWAYVTYKTGTITYRIYDTATTPYASVYQDSSSVKKLTGEVVIPATVTYNDVDYSVTKIERWYYGNEVDLVMPNSIVQESDVSWSYIGKLNSLKLPENATFTSFSLSNVRNTYDELIIPKTITTITVPTSTSYGGSWNLKSFKVDADNANYKSEEGVLFTKDGSVLVSYPYKKEGVSYNVPAGVTSIGDYAFLNDDNLETIILPAGLLSIGKRSFYDCNSLYRCEIPTSVTIIDEYAFYNCGKLSVCDVSSLSSLQTIAQYAFYSCNLSVSNNTFVLPANIKTIGYRAFSNAFNNNYNITVEFPTTLGESGSQLKLDGSVFDCYTVRSYMTDPVNCNTYEAFWNVSRIYIPAGTKDIYKAKTGWGYDESKLVESASLDYDSNLADPTITPILDAVNNLVSVKLSSTSTADGATILYRIFQSGAADVDVADWYTYNGTDAFPMDDFSTIKAITTKGGKYSNMSQYTVDLSSLRCPTPTIITAVNSTTMTMATTVTGATIYYTIDNSTPSASNGTKYTGQITLAGNYTYKAVAVKDGMFTSNVAEYTVNWFKCKTPTATYAAASPDGNNVVVSLSTDEEGVTLKYMPSGSNEYLTYTGPVTTPMNSYFYYVATKPKYNDSDTPYIYTYRDDIKCAKPSITIDQTSKTLTLTAAEGVNIYYTLNDFDPVISDEYKYGGSPVTLTGNCTIKAIAHKDGWFQSDQAYTNINNWFTCSDVVIEQVFENGTPLMRLSLKDSTSVDYNNMNIYYLVGDYYTYEDGWRNNGNVYSDPVVVEDGRTIYAVAIKDGYIMSNRSSKQMDYSAYTRCSMPYIELDNEAKTITMTTSESNGKIYYTLDGTTPTTASTLYTAPFTSETNCLVRAITARDPETVDEVTTTYANSEVSSISLDDWFRVANVKFHPVVGSGENEYKMVLSAEDGATIEYGINQYGGTIYTEKDTFDVAAGNYIYAIARKEGSVDSYWSEYYVSKSSYTVRQPNVNANPETRLLTVTTETEGADIYYTSDGTDPTNESTKLEGSEVTTTQNGEYKFIAIKAGMHNSSVQQYSVTWFRVPDVTITPFAEDNVLKVKLECEDPDAIIYWGYNGDYESSNVAANTLYSEPFAIKDGGNVYASAVKPGYNDAYWQSSGWIYKSSYTLNTPTITVAADTTVTISSSDAGATLYYTLNGDDPTIESNKFVEKFKLTANSTIKAIAVANGKLNSSVRTREYTGFRVNEVVITPIVEDNKVKVKLETTTPDAQIYYAINSTISPVSSNTKYTAPFEINDGDYIYANALKDGYTEAGWSSHSWIYFGNYTCNQPTITIKTDSTVVITGDEGATFYYTIGGAEPTTSSTKFTSDFKMTRNDTIKAIAVQDNKITSSVAWNYYSGYKVASVVITPIVEDNKVKVKLETTTPGAKIYYAINETNPTTTLNMNYDKPFEISNGDYIYANAVKDGYSEAGWSSHNWIYFNEYTCSEPTITVRADTMVVISANEGASVYYTLDESVPTTSSTKYTSEFKLTKNVVIKAIAVEDGKISSNVKERSYNNFTVASPEMTLNGTKMTFTSETPGVTFTYCYEPDPRDDKGNLLYSRKYTGPFDVEYNSTIYVQASKDGFNTSYSNTWISNTAKCKPVEQVSYNGHSMKLKAEEGTTIWYTVNGETPNDNTNGWYSNVYQYVDSIKINNTGKIRAIATAQYKNQSDVSDFEVTSFAGETGATTEKAGGLAASMGWSTPSDITEFTITGPINASDISFVKNKMTSLEKLDLSNATIDDGNLPDNAFAGMPLLTFSSPNGLKSVGNNIFTGCDELAAVVWNTTARIPDNAFDDDVNPNLLLFVPSEDAAPTNSSARNIIVNGTAKNIYLSDGEGNNFYCPQSFYTQNITYIHDFKLESGNGYGWETIALPFQCSRFVHESKGELKPFAEYDQLADKGQYKPFWLRELTDIGFNDVSQIEANKPYIISMPNNESYATRYRVGGKVTFSATDIWVPVTEPQAVQKGVNTLYANFLNDSDTDHMLLLNTEDTDEHKAGSIFVKNSGRAVRPFEAYVLSQANARAYISITRGFGDDPDGDEGTTAIKVVEPDANGLVKVYNLSGVLVKQGAKEDVLRGLAKGVYIMNGKRVIVK